ncbi:MAG TPA: isochorismatase family cysteine hydrolase [Candidatus Paceibacterota bacterium]
MPKKALLVIDVDHGDGWKPEQIQNEPSRQLVAKNIKTELARWRANNGLIVFVMFGANTALAEFLEHRHDNVNEPAFVKTEIDAFTNEKLAEYLQGQGVTEVVLAGCQTFCCVKATAFGAVNAGFSVTLLRDLVFHPFDKQYDAEERWLDYIKGIIKMNPDSKLSAKIE